MSRPPRATEPHTPAFSACVSHPVPAIGSLIFQGSKSLFTELAITTRHFPVLWPYSHTIANHFPIGHSSFHYSSSSTLNFGVLNGCVTEKDVTIHLLSKNATYSLRPTTCLKTPLRSELRWLTSSDTTCHPSFHYSSSSTLNSRVLNGCVTENCECDTHYKKTSAISLLLYPTATGRAGGRGEQRCWDPLGGADACASNMLRLVSELRFFGFSIEERFWMSNINPIQDESPFIEREKNYEIYREIFGDPIYDVYEDDLRVVDFVFNDDSFANPVCAKIVQNEIRAKFVHDEFRANFCMIQRSNRNVFICGVKIVW
ncbi:hypothetical protein YC2023_049360 [Brassica napus]